MLDSALWAFRTAFKVSTSSTPFKLVYGLEAVVPMEYLVPSLRVAAENRLSPEDSVNHRLDQLLGLEEDRLQSAYIAEIIQQRRQAWVNRNIKLKIFKEDDLVLLYNSKLGSHVGKLKLRYVGPFRIVKVLGQGTFLLSDLSGNLFPKLVNGFKLKKFYGQISNEEIQVGLVSLVGKQIFPDISSTQNHHLSNILVHKLGDFEQDY